jgi:RNA polymerase sigma factor (sigma-70 family)
MSEAVIDFTGSEPNGSWDDGTLVRVCLDGNERAWHVLIEKYRRLIYSVPVRYGLRPEDAADVFQHVCMNLFTELPRLRNSGALRSWLITVAAHQSFHMKKRRQVLADREQGGRDEDLFAAPISAEFAEQLEREQALREAISELPPRCRELVRLLFYEQPPLPYRDIAKRLGLAVGSVGYIRGRCLKRLQQALRKGVS